MSASLIGLAMLCGLAILVAGGIQLFRIQDSRDREVEVLSLGEAGTLSGITATVADVQRPGPIVLAVDVAAGADSTGWTTSPRRGWCRATGGAPAGGCAGRPRAGVPERAAACRSATQLPRCLRGW